MDLYPLAPAGVCVCTRRVWQLAVFLSLVLQLVNCHVLNLGTCPTSYTLAVGWRYLVIMACLGWTIELHQCIPPHRYHLETVMLCVLTSRNKCS